MGPSRLLRNDRSDVTVSGSRPCLAHRAIVDGRSTNNCGAGAVDVALRMPSEGGSTIRGLGVGGRDATDGTGVSGVSHVCGTARRQSQAEAWAIVLAAGSGMRLRSLTLDSSGSSVPKQYCSLAGGRTLLANALARAQRIVSREQLIVIVASEHRQWWEQDLGFLPQQNIIVQPANRGTASGILLPLLSILERDRHARVAILPSDHFVLRERVLSLALQAALDELGTDTITLLGIRPEGPEADYGWIVPATQGPDVQVEAFVEKPTPVEARACLSRGGVWNSFLLAAKAGSLFDLFGRRLPRMLGEFQEVFRSGGEARTQALTELYTNMDTVDFSRAVLQGSEEHLRLKIVSECGWTDLGTPERVARCVESIGSGNTRLARPHRSHGQVDLEDAVVRSRKAEPPRTTIPTAPLVVARAQWSESKRQLESSEPRSETTS